MFLLLHRFLAAVLLHNFVEARSVFDMYRLVETRTLQNISARCSIKRENTAINILYVIPYYLL